jgi:SH3 domain protein
MLKRLFVLACLGLAAWAAFAEAGDRAFVSDSLEAPLRSGPSLQHKVIAMLKSGRDLEILQEQEGWSLVRIASKEGGVLEGWILSRYLMTRLPWEIQLREVEKENARLTESLTPNAEALNAARLRESQLEKQLNEVNESFSLLKRNYEALTKEAKGFLEMKEAHAVSQMSLEKCKEALDNIAKELVKLEASERNSWFLSGAAVLFGGLLTGLLLGRMQRRRKSSLID